MVKPRKILSLNGGGVRGLFTISILASIEEQIEIKTGEQGVKIGEYFDLISGASIGGILALGLAKGVSARKLKEILEKHSSNIFPSRWCHQLPLIGGLISKLSLLVRAKYKSEPLKKAIQEALGDNVYIRDLKRRIVIPIVNITSGTPSIIKTKHDPDFARDDKFKLIDIGMATSAAPTYFPPYKIEGSYYLDGGLIANDASLIAIHEAKHFIGWDVESIHVLNVGTMGKGFTINHNKLNNSNGGYFKLWGGGSDLIDIILSANQMLHGYMSKQSLMGDNRYFVLDESITPNQSESLTLDNASKQSQEMLIGRANKVSDFAVCDKTMMSCFFSEKAEEFIHPDRNK